MTEQTAPYQVTTTRAERATRRRNKQIAARYPLLAVQLAETVTENAQRIEKAEQDYSNLVDQRNQSNLAAWELGQAYKAVALAYLPFALYEELESRYQRIYGNRGEYAEPIHAGHDLADWWWCALRDNSVPWCWDHCPNNIFHEREWFRASGVCPTCRKPLEKPEEKPKIIQQMLFGEK